MRTGTQNSNWKGGRIVASNGYVLLRRPDHQRADVRGYVYEHIVVAEAAIGRALIPGEQVHHRNDVKTDNRPDNLEVLTVAVHRARHRKPGSRLRAPGANNATVACACGCGKTFDRFDCFGRPRAFVSGHNNVARDARSGRWS